MTGAWETKEHSHGKNVFPSDFGIDVMDRFRYLLLKRFIVMKIRNHLINDNTL